MRLRFTLEHLGNTADEYDLHYFEEELSDRLDEEGVAHRHSGASWSQFNASCSFTFADADAETVEAIADDVYQNGRWPLQAYASRHA